MSSTLTNRPASRWSRFEHRFPGLPEGADPAAARAIEHIQQTIRDALDGADAARSDRLASDEGKRTRLARIHQDAKAGLAKLDDPLTIAGDAARRLKEVAAAAEAKVEMAIQPDPSQLPHLNTLVGLLAGRDSTGIGRVITSSAATLADNSQSPAARSRAAASLQAVDMVPDWLVEIPAELRAEGRNALRTSLGGQDAARSADLANQVGHVIEVRRNAEALLKEL